MDLAAPTLKKHNFTAEIKIAYSDIIIIYYKYVTAAAKTPDCTYHGT